MREILFRGQNSFSFNWITGHYHQDPEDGNFIMEFEYIPVLGNSDEPPSGYFRTNIIQVVPESIGQYTGLTDKNGTKIFEKDINQNGLVIKWNQLHNCFGWFSKKGFEKEILSDNVDDKGNITNCYLSDIEIIGNYIDNPELLK